MYSSWEDVIKETFTKGISDYFLEDMREIMSKALAYNSDEVFTKLRRQGNARVPVGALGPVDFSWRVNDDSRLLST
ncbi:hypothetical protein PM082_021985 [Marasmius tenuissimus]|nr:hypothetical protein PM082_021985 [Marasmius tenuissimus]